MKSGGVRTRTISRFPIVLSIALASVNATPFATEIITRLDLVIGKTSAGAG